MQSNNCIVSCSTCCSHASKSFKSILQDLLLQCAQKSSLSMAGLHEKREFATPLISASQPAGGTHQQVMSPTLGYGTAGHGTNVGSVTRNPPNSGTEGGQGFASDMAARRGLEGTGQADTAESGGMQSHH